MIHARVARGASIWSPPRKSSKLRRCDGHMADKHFIQKGELVYHTALPPGGELGYETWMHLSFCAGCTPEELL